MTADELRLVLRILKHALNVCDGEGVGPEEAESDEAIRILENEIAARVRVLDGK